MEGNENKTNLASKLALPGAILVAAILISGTLVYVNLSKAPGAEKAGNTPAALAKIKLNDSDHRLGDPKAKVTIVEFADFRCPFCERFFQQAKKQIIRDYVDTGKASYVFKNYAQNGQRK